MKNALIILTAIAVVSTTVFWLSSLDDRQMSKNEQKATVKKSEHLQHLVSYPQAHSTLPKTDSKQATESKLTVIDDSVELAQASTPFARSESAEKVLKASGKLRENLRGEVYLEIDNNHISTLEAGDILKLDIPFFDMYQDVAVEGTKLDSRGNKTINAAFLMNDDIYTTTITINERAIYGHIETPHGIYSLAGNGQYAWMAEAKDLVHGAIPDKIGGHSHDGSADPQPVIEPEPITITDK